MEQDDMPALVDDAAQNHSDSHEDSSDDDSIVDEEPTTCLFCTKVCCSVDAAIAHLLREHEVNLAELKNRFDMDQYAFIKLINCIRSENMPASKLLHTNEMFWTDEKYLKPKDYEPWLTYDYEGMLLNNQLDSNTKCTDNATTSVQKLQAKVQEQALLLEQAADDMKKMRAAFQRLVDKESGADNKSLNCVSASSLQADEGYFSSYAHFGIHHEMLSDVVRTTSYRDALLNNKDFIAGKDVLDVGCGTSVLSIFASQAGAKTVVGVDNSDIVYNAMDIVKLNDIHNVTLLKGRLEDTVLPQEKYDVIISEWMGYFLLFEGMLDSIIYARDNHLKEGGMILPNRCTMSLLGYGSDELFQTHVTFWNNVYGLDMSTMRKEVMHEPLIDVVDPKHILTESEVIADLNMATVDLKYSNFSYDFKLRCTKAGNLSAILGYFDTYFDLPNPVMFGTAPTDKSTHWKQVAFFLEKPVAVQADEVVCGNIVCKRSRKSARSLDIVIEVFGKKYKYYLD